MAAWITVTIMLLAIIGMLLINLKTLRQECEGSMETLKRRSVQDAAERFQDDELVTIAMDVVKALDEEKEAGEWKFHQAYAKLTKDVKTDKWKVGLAIHQALAKLRKA